MSGDDTSDFAQYVRDQRKREAGLDKLMSRTVAALGIIVVLGGIYTFATGLTAAPKEIEHLKAVDEQHNTELRDHERRLITSEQIDRQLSADLGEIKSDVKEILRKRP